MRINNIRVLLIFSVFLLSISLVNALCWKCTVNPGGSVSYTCDYNVCNWHDCQNEGIPIGSCGGGGGIDSQPPNFTISSPINNHYYNTSEVWINASSDEMCRSFKRKVDRESYTTICTGCQSASYKKTRLIDGEHTVIVAASDYKGNEDTKTINFVVDTTLPVIDYIFPGNNFFVRKGIEEFKVRYDEENVDEIILYYKVNSGSEQSEEFSDCEDGEDKECSLLVDLSNYDEGDEIEFYIKIKDKAGHVVVSAEKTVTINAELAENPFTILSPVDDGKYGDKKINISVQSALYADLIEYSIDGKKYSKLCAACMQYNKILSIKDGEHNLSIRVTYEETKVEKAVDFYVDSLKPSIKTTLPRAGSYAKGNTNFSITYSELYLESIILYYGIGGEGEGQIELEGCESGNNKICSVNVDLTDYNGQEILYFFEVNDGVNSVSSDNYNLLVDVNKPIIYLNSPNDEEIYTSEKVLFDIDLDGDIASLDYIDDYVGARSLKPKNLCKNCDSYKNSVNFKEGNHNVKIIATDLAGNTNEVNINFKIDTKYPAITKVSSFSKYATNGEFTLIYNEENLVEVTAYYKGVGEGTYKTQNFGNCPSGKKAQCKVTLNLNGYNDENINYYFALTDVLGQTVTSDGPVTMMVDTEVPEMEINSIENLEVFNTRNVLIDIELSEQVKTLSYLDSSSISPRYITLCSSCSSYNSERSFSLGAHEIKFKAVDFAGNVAEETRNFVVNY